MKHQYVKYVKYTWKPCLKYVKSTVKAPEQRQGYCSSAFVFDFKGIFAAQLNIYDGPFLLRNLAKN